MSDTAAPTTGATERKTKASFWDNVNKNGPIAERRPDLGPCWLWMGPVSDGYGKYFKERAHRKAFEDAIGPLPAGMVPDHLCRNRACVRPEHMEAVTNRENVLRGESPTVLIYRSETCGKGHRKSEENVIRLKNGHVECRICRRQSQANYRARCGQRPIGSLRNCATCGRPFPIETSGHRYCSEECGYAQRRSA